MCSKSDISGTTISQPRSLIPASLVRDGEILLRPGSLALVLNRCLFEEFSHVKLVVDARLCEYIG